MRADEATELFNLFFTLEAVWTTECLHLRVKAQVYTCTASMMLQIMWQHCQRPSRYVTWMYINHGNILEMSRQTWLRQWRESQVAFCTYVKYSALISTIFTSSLDPIPDWFHPAPTVQLCLQPCGYVAVLCWGQKDETLVRHVGDGGKMQLFVYQKYVHVCRCRCVYIYIIHYRSL